MRPPDLEGLIQEYERENYGSSPAQRALTLIDQALSEPFMDDMYIFPSEFEMLCRTAGLRARIDANPGITMILASYATHYRHPPEEARQDALRVASVRDLIRRLKDGTI